MKNAMSRLGARRENNGEDMLKRFLPILLLILTLILTLASLLLAGCERKEATTTTAVTTGTAGETSTTAAHTLVSKHERGKWKFTFNMYLRRTHLVSATLEMWMTEITKRTNGAVEFEFLPGASLSPANKVYETVLNNVCDIGFSYFAATPGSHPVSELLDYPFGSASGWISTMAANAYYNHFKPAELENVHVLCLYASGPQLLLTTSKPVKARDDLEGTVLRCTGVGVQIAQALGAEGYDAPQSEGYQLMSKRVVEGNLAPIEVLKTWKLAEVVSDVTECYSVGSMAAFYLVMNRATWESLPPDIQQVFGDVTQQYVEILAKVASAVDHEGVEFYQSLGANKRIITLSEEESARWKRALMPVIDKKVAALQAAGFTEDYRGFMEATLTELRAEAPSPAECAAWVKQNVTPSSDE
jgi:TRAP-type C4-dicarboxylate transport system substrate-binding protein